MMSSLLHVLASIKERVVKRDLLKTILKDEGCQYQGIMHKAYSKWWMQRVKAWWEKNIPELKSFRYVPAEESRDAHKKMRRVGTCCCSSYRGRHEP